MKRLRRLSVGATVSLATIIITIAVVSVGILSIERQLRLAAEKEAETTARAAAARITASVQAVFDSAFDVVTQAHDNMVALKEQGIEDPKVYDLLLRRIIDSGTDRYGAWYVWNAKDAPMQGSEKFPAGIGYATYWHQNGMEMLRDAVPPEILSSDLYLVPSAKGHAYLLEPHAIDAVASDSTLVTSFSKPIMFGDRVIGVIAVDLKLDAISDSLSSIDLPRGAAFTVASSGGVVAMSTQRGLAGSSLRLSAPALAARLVGTKGSGGSDLVLDHDTGATTLHSDTPIHFSGVETPWRLLLDVPEQSIFAGATRDKLSLLVVPALGLVVILGIILLVVRHVVSQPLRELAAIIIGLGDGLFDFIVPGCTRADEIGDIARAIERLQASGIEIARLHEAQGDSEFQRQVDRRKELDSIASRFSQSIETVVATLNGVAANVAAYSRDMSASSEATQTTIAGVSRTSSSAKTSIVSVATATSALLETIVSIGDQTRHSRAVWERMQSGTASTDQSVSAFKHTVEQIDGIAGDIRAIADQINMIALNATIEAARAGEAGRGFAVVAQEIKHLAAQTAKATDYIGSHISSVHRAFKDANLHVDDMMGAFVDLRATSQAITADLDLQTGATDDIRRLVEQAERGADLVEQDVGGLIAQADAVHGTAETMRLQAALLSDETRRLNEEVARFIAFMKAA